MKTLESAMAEKSALQTVPKTQPLIKSDKTLAALSLVASKDPERVILNSVLVEDGKAIATNGRILLALPYAGESPDKTIHLTTSGVRQSLKIDPKEKKPWAQVSGGVFVNDGYFPNWKAVVPGHVAPVAFTLTEQHEAGIVAMGHDAKPNPCYDNAAAADILSIQIGDERVFFPLFQLALLISTIRKAKVKGPLVIQPTLADGFKAFQAHPCLITAASEPGMIAVIMVARPGEALALN